MNKAVIKRALETCVGLGRDVVLVSNGKNSAVVRELLRREYGREPRFSVDSRRYDGVTVFPPEALPEGAEECVFLITAEHSRDQEELRRALRPRVPGARIATLQDLDGEWQAILADEEKVRLDFLGVGFPKCLTTSVFEALRENPDIFMPDAKESHFLDGRLDRAGHEQYKAEFRPARGTGRLTGEIEPQYGFIPDRVRAYYGNGVKLLFFLRDPRKALYSFFRMCVRDVGREELPLFEEFGRVCPEMYDKWAESHWQTFLYGRSLGDYLAYYPREQLRAVLAEELLADVPGQMHGLQRFIGLPEEKCVDYPVLPRANRGSAVSADYLSALVNLRLHEFSAEIYERAELRSEYYKKLLPQLMRHTLVRYDEPPLPETGERLLGYYMDDIRLLEEILGRSLRGLWY